MAQGVERLISTAGPPSTVHASPVRVPMAPASASARVHRLLRGLAVDVVDLGQRPRPAEHPEAHPPPTASRYPPAVSPQAVFPLEGGPELLSFRLTAAGRSTARWRPAEPPPKRMKPTARRPARRGPTRPPIAVGCGRRLTAPSQVMYSAIGVRQSTPKTHRMTANGNDTGRVQPAARPTAVGMGMEQLLRTDHPSDMADARPGRVYFFGTSFFSKSGKRRSSLFFSRSVPADLAASPAAERTA